MMSGGPAHRLLLPAVCAVLMQWGCTEGERPGRHEVEITNFVFAPDTLRAAVGDTIVWVNRDVVPHTASADDGGWDSGSLGADQTWTHVVDRAGRVRYVCTIHPSMVGWIEVE